MKHPEQCVRVDGIMKTRSLSCDVSVGAVVHGPATPILTTDSSDEVKSKRIIPIPAPVCLIKRETQYVAEESNK